MNVEILETNLIKKNFALASQLARDEELFTSQAKAGLHIKVIN